MEPGRGDREEELQQSLGKVAGVLLPLWSPVAVTGKRHAVAAPTRRRIGSRYGARSR